jgi:hypothetical protein
MRRVLFQKKLTDILFYVRDIPQSTRTISEYNLIKWCQWDHLLDRILMGLRVGLLEVAGKLAVSPHRKKGWFFLTNLGWDFSHKSLTDSGISHRFLRLFSFYTIARRFEYLHICEIFLHRCRRRISSNIAARPWRPPCLHWIISFSHNTSQARANSPPQLHWISHNLNPPFPTKETQW